MEAIYASIVAGIISILLAVLKNGFDSKKTTNKIIDKLDKIDDEIHKQGMDLLQIKMDKFITKYKLKQKINEDALKELSEIYHRYHKLGGNGYYAEMIKKIMAKYSEGDEI